VIILRGRWCHINVLNVRLPAEELELVYDKFPKHHIKILLGDFNAKVGREDILVPTIGNESLQEISNDNGVRLMNFATSKNLTVKNKMFP
jgi:hypothetical protein